MSSYRLQFITLPKVEDFDQDSVSDLQKRSTYTVYMYFGNFMIQTFKEKPVVTAWSLVSSFGGVLGLFVGCSLLSLVELCTIVVAHMLKWCARLSRGGRVYEVRQ